MESTSIHEKKAITIILNYNTWDETVDCIESILNSFPRMFVLVVDNCSLEDSTEKFNNYVKNKSNVRIIKAQENKGYSAGNNVGLKYALENNFDYIFISNSDIIVRDDAIEKMIDLSESIENCGLVGPHIYNKRDEFVPFLLICKKDFSVKIKNMALKIPGAKFFLKKFIKSFIISNEIDNPLEVFSVHGSFYLMTRECAEYLYPLDERTFLYEEEPIIGCKLEKSKFKAVLCPFTHVNHLAGVSTKGMSPFAFRCMTDSEQIYSRNYIGCTKFQANILFWIRRFEYLAMCIKREDYRLYKHVYMCETKKFRNENK